MLPVIPYISKTMTRLFGSRNERLVRAYMKRVEQINRLEPEYRRMTDAELRAQTEHFRDRYRKEGSSLDLTCRVMAAAREGFDRAVGIRSIFNPEYNFDASQLPPAARRLYEVTLEKAAAIPPTTSLGHDHPIPGWMQVEIPLELYAAVRELYQRSRPPFRARPFDVQLIGGMVLGEGKIAEMKTGEGKTIVAPLACYVACTQNLQCHVITVNDYLVQRDRDWVFPFYFHMGLTVGAIHPYHMQPNEKKAEAYRCDVLYGTNSEFGFDYLRDNMKLSTQEQVQKRRDFCIVDEVDSILIDEARTPLIISGPAHDDAPRYGLADQVARHLIQKQREWDAEDQKVQSTMMRIKGLEGDIRNARDKNKIQQMREELKSLQAKLPQLEALRDTKTQYYEVEREKKAAHLTHHGVAEAQKVADIGSFYVGNNMDFPHLLENALRAHVIYQRNKEYVVQNGEVIIVDEFTGRLMIGRQWSDGLHQAIETKEKVKIKEETQTMATVTIQNYFKLYKRLAGMTGTAITEATEFNTIYNLDVVCIPTNLPVVRKDREDLIFLSSKDKWEAILDEIKRMHDIGRPVLVGTTSVETSEALSAMLTRKHSIPHAVLNAKQHEREAHIVAEAGRLGAVMIATNMAGRGTDIKLAPIDRADLVLHWQKRNLLSADAKAEMTDDEILTLAYRHQAQQKFKLKPADASALSREEARLMLMRRWVVDHAGVDENKAASYTAEQCEKVLDGVPEFQLHRLAIYNHVNDMGGLHIVGTERHESRRIDNQLRGRAGRQGDFGSSRFFISLEDDLMKMFAGKNTMAILSRLGMKEGDAIEHSMVTRAVERAQRKVEERNFEQRKSLLEYDEVMEHQRNTFYGIRQNVLEGKGIEKLIFDYIGKAVDDAVDIYKDRYYVQTQVAEWCRQTLDISVDPSRLRVDDRDELKEQIRKEARSEMKQQIDVTLGEYMSNDLPPEDWDVRGLSNWARTRFNVTLPVEELRQMNVHDVSNMLIEAASQQIGKQDLSGLEKFLVPLYGERGLSEWVKNKFNIDITPEELSKLNAEQASKTILEKSRQAYQEREVTYPVEFVLDTAFQYAQHDGPWAAQQLANWANHRYEMNWTPEDVARHSGNDLHKMLIEASRKWLRGGELERVVDAALTEHGSNSEALLQWARQRFLQPITAEELSNPQTRRDVLLEKGRQMLRAELTQLERFVLLQILDSTWKDHLYAMDQLKDSVGLKAYAEKDPRIEYKREGSELFVEMQKLVRDKVTDLIFRARLTANIEMRSVYDNQQAQHAEPVNAVAAAAQGTAQQQQDLTAAQQAGAGAQPMSRHERRAQAAQERKKGH